MSIRTVQTTNLGLRSTNPDGFTFEVEPTNTLTTWKRNPAWLSMPAVSNTESKVVILMGIEPDSNFVAMLFQGAYTVDWGDGSTPQNIANNTQCNYRYDYANTAFDNTDGPVTFTDTGDLVTRNSHGYANNDKIWFHQIVTTTGIVPYTNYFVVNTTSNTFQLSSTSGGSPLPLTNNGTGKILPFKQVLITVTPQGGDTLRLLNFNRRHANIASVTTAESNWLDVLISGPNINSISFAASSPSIRHNSLERIQVLSTGILDASRTYMFAALSGLKTINPFNVGGWSASTNATSMFEFCRAIETIPSIDTSTFTNMATFLKDCNFLKEIPYIETGNNTSFSSFFSGCLALTKVPQLDLKSASTTGAMFSGCRSLYKIPPLNTTTLLNNIGSMFNNCSNLVEIPDFETSNVTNMDSTFGGCSNLIKAPNIVTGNVVASQFMFNNCSILEELPKTLDTKNANSFNGIFLNCYKLKSIPKLDTSKVLTFANAFNNCLSLKNIPRLETGNATNLSRMFQGCYSFTKFPELTNTSLVTDMGSMFNVCTGLSGGTFNYETGNVTSMTTMFNECRMLKTAPTMNTAKVTSFANVFSNCYELKTVPQYDTSNATNTYGMFYNCFSLEEIPDINTSKVTNAVSMFQSCLVLSKCPKIDLSNTVYAANMFDTCRTLKEIPSFNASKMIDIIRTFATLNNLKYLPPDFATSLGNTSITFANTFRDSTSLSVIPALNLGNTTSLSTWLAGSQNVCEIDAYNIKVSFAANCKLSNTTITTLCDNQLLTNATATFTINGSTGAGVVQGTAGGSTTSGCTVVTMASTTLFEVGAEVYGTNTPLTTPIAVTFQDTGDTVTLNNHQLSNNDQVSFATIVTTTGIVINTIYYVVNTTTNTFQVADTSGGAAKALTTNGSGTMRYRAHVASINPGVSVTLDRPCTGTGSALTIQNRTGGARVGGALLRGWAVG